VQWYLGDTTQSIAYLSAGYIDVALTYNAAAEEAAVKSGNAIERKLTFYVTSLQLWYGCNGF